MEQKLVQLHRQSLNYSNVLYMPYKAYTTLVRHLGLLDSRKLWSKLVKYLSIVRKAPIQEVIESFIASQDVRTLEGIETKWALMNLLFFMVVTWVRLGKHHHSRVSNDQTKSIRVSLALTGGRQKSELNLLIQSSFKLQKEQFSRQLHKTIIGECQKYKLHFQVDVLQQKYQIFSQEELRFDEIVLPSVMQISGVRFELHSKLFIRRHNKPTQAKDCLNLKQYTTILKAFRNIDGIKYDKTIYSFIDKFIKEIDKKLLSLQKEHKYFFIITPRDILIFDKGKDIRVEIDLKYQECYFYDQKKLPENYLNNIYTDWKLDKQKKIDKNDFWSVGLCLLAITSRYQDIDTFQKMLLRARKKDQLHTFVREEIDRVEVERQFDPEAVVRMLKEWLRYGDIKKEEIINEEKNKIDEFFDKKVIQPQLLQDDKETNIHWLQGILVKPDNTNTDAQPKQTEIQKTSERTTEKSLKPEEKPSDYPKIQTNTQQSREQIPAQNQIRKVLTEQKEAKNVVQEVERKDSTSAIEKVLQKEQENKEEAVIEQVKEQKQEEKRQPEIVQPIQSEELKPQPQPQPSVPVKSSQTAQPPQTSQKQQKKSGQEQHTDTVPIPTPKPADKKQPDKQNQQLKAVADQAAEQAGAVKNVQFIRSIGSNTKTSGQVYFNGNQTKNFTVYSNNPSEKEERPFSNREKVVTINGKDIKIDLNYNQNQPQPQTQPQPQDQKPSTIKHTWRDTQRFIVDKQAFYSKTQDKMKKLPFERLSRDEQGCNLVAPQIDPKHIAQIHRILVDDDQVFMKMGYFSADMRRSKQAVCHCDSEGDKGKGNNEDINGILNKLQGQEEEVTIQIEPEEEIPQREVFYNSCTHGQCTNCFKKFFDQKFENQQFENIQCFQKNCNQKLSLQIFKNNIKDSQKRIKNRHLSKYLVNDYLKKHNHHLLNSGYIRCRRKQCEGELDFHVIEEGNKIFFCQSCREFICIRCFQPYHGSIPCQDYPRAQNQLSLLRQSIASIPRVDSLTLNINRTRVRKFLKEANLGHPIAVDELRAMLLMGEVFKCTRKKDFLDVIRGQGEESLAVDGVIESLKEYLHTLHSSIRNMGNLTDSQIRQVAKNNHIITGNLHKIYIHKDAYLHIFCNV